MEEPARTLPDDVVLEILARLADVPALFRFATAAKRWRRLIADFLRRRWQENSTHPAFLVGFITQRRCYGSEDDNEYPFPHEDEADRDSPPVFVPAPRSILGPVFWSPPSGVLDGAKPLTARRGLLLVRLAPVPPRSTVVILLAVCDLLAGTCHELPPLQCDREWAPSSYAILTGQDCGAPDGHKKPRSPAPNCSTFFKVLAIGFIGNCNRGDVEYSLRTFSSAEPVWATPAKRFGEDRRCGGPHYCPNLQDDATVCGRGMTHWLCGNWWSESSWNYFTIDVSPEDGQVSSAKLSLLEAQPTPEICQLAVVDGILSLFLLYARKEGLCLDTWTRGVDDGAHWHRARVIKLKPPEHRRIERVLYFWSGEKSGTLLIVDSNMHKYVVYLETGAMEEVSSQFRGMVGDAVPVEIDWPDLFMSRLAAVGGSH